MREQTPEARRKRPLEEHLAQVKPGGRIFVVFKRAAIGVFREGFIHAGNIAYLALLTMFPFFITMAALAQILGRNADVQQALTGFLTTLPRSVGELVSEPINGVLQGSGSGPVLWFGGLVGLWTVGSFVETIRDILYKAYGVKPSGTFLQYRMGSVAIIIVSVVLAMAAFSAQVALTGVEQFVWRILPFSDRLQPLISLSRLAPLLALMVALYGLFLSLTPSRYRLSDCPKWPGPLFVAIWWILVTMALPLFLGLVGGYGRTYGSLAGVIVTLLFFWLVGLGLVFGAHLNAALAEGTEPSVKEAPGKV